MAIGTAAAIGIPLFIALSVFFSRVAGDREINRLNGKLDEERLSKSALQSRFGEFDERMAELREARRENKEKTERIMDLEEEITSYRDAMERLPKECRPERTSYLPLGGAAEGR